MDSTVSTLQARDLPGLSVTVAREQLQRFARATSLPDLVYRDLDAARSAGYPDLPLPSTYLFSLEMLRPSPYAVLEEIGVDRAHTLHGEQSFEYFSMCFAGDTLTFSPRLTDDYVRKGGALRFLVRDTSVTRDNTEVARLRNVLVVRQGEAQ